MKRYYLAYGSNLNLEHMENLCPGAKAAGRAILDDHELEIRGTFGSFYLTADYAKGKSMPAGVFEVNKDDEKALDRYEACPDLYLKKECSVNCSFHDGTTEKIDAFFYAMPETFSYGKASDSYLENCKKGYGDFGFDPALVDEAAVRSLEHQ